MLAKMMYSSGGMSMPCFGKGEATITALEARINPAGLTNDSLLNEHCQELVNRSLDNWASKWYDRFQYWAQGVFY
jgi:phosphatidylinositol 4-kinase